MNLYLNSWKQVFGRPKYIILAVLTASLILALTFWAQNYKLLIYVLKTDSFNYGIKLKIWWLTLKTFQTAYSLVSQLFMIALAGLSGINLSLLVYFLKNKRDLLKLAGLSGTGLLIGVLGIGCGPCGLVVLSALIGLSATTSLMLSLPWQGLEFGLSGIIILLISIYLLLKRIAQGEVCKINKRR